MRHPVSAPAVVTTHWRSPYLRPAPPEPLACRRGDRAERGWAGHPLFRAHHPGRRGCQRSRGRRRRDRCSDRRGGLRGDRGGRGGRAGIGEGPRRRAQERSWGGRGGGRGRVSASAKGLEAQGCLLVVGADHDRPGLVAAAERQEAVLELRALASPHELAGRGRQTSVPRSETRAPGGSVSIRTRRRPAAGFDAVTARAAAGTATGT